jgi:protein-tyrosine-phosphatase
LKRQTSPRLVVFVCEDGSAKSLVAASFFERLAKERGIAVRALSRGTAPDASMPAAVVEALRGDVSASYPKARQAILSRLRSLFGELDRQRRPERP